MSIEIKKTRIKNQEVREKTKKNKIPILNTQF